MRVSSAVLLTGLVVVAASVRAQDQASVDVEVPESSALVIGGVVYEGVVSIEYRLADKTLIVDGVDEYTHTVPVTEEMRAADDAFLELDVAKGMLEEGVSRDAVLLEIKRLEREFVSKLRQEAKSKDNKEIIRKRIDSLRAEYQDVIKSVGMNEDGEVYYVHRGSPYRIYIATWVKKRPVLSEVWQSRLNSIRDYFARPTHGGRHLVVLETCGSVRFCTMKTKAEYESAIREATKRPLK